MIKRCAPALILFALVDCGNSVEGVVQFQGKPANGARITIGDEETETDADGEFSMYFAPAGTQLITATLDRKENGSVAVHDVLEIGENSQNITLQLPDPVVLSLVSAVDGTVEVQWTPSTSPDFRWQELFRYANAELSKESELLLLQGSNVDEVSHVDAGRENLPVPLMMDFFYRVVVSDDIGYIGTSNVLRANIPLWDENALSKRYALELKSQFLGAAEVGGICWDGQAVWVAYSTSTGGYYDLRKVWIARYDITTWTISHQIGWDDGYAWPYGIACDGQGIWVNYNATDAARLERRDAATGDVLKTFAARDGQYADLDFNRENLLAVSPWNSIDVLNPETGVTNRTYDTPFEYSHVAGIAVRNGEIWVAASSHHELAVLDRSHGTQIGVVKTNVPMKDWGAAPLYMTFVGDDIAIVRNGRIYIYGIIPD